MSFSIKTVLTEIAVISLYCGSEGISKEDTAAQRFIHMRAEVLLGSGDKRSVDDILNVGEELIKDFSQNDPVTAQVIQEMKRNPAYAAKMYGIYQSRILPMLADDFRN